MRFEVLQGIKSTHFIKYTKKQSFLWILPIHTVGIKLLRCLMDILVFTVGSIAAVACGWFALQLFFKLLLGFVKLGVLAVLAYFAAQVTWLNAEVPQVASTEVESLIELVSQKWDSVNVPKVSLQFQFPEDAAVPGVAEIGLDAAQLENNELRGDSQKRYF